MVRLTGGGKIFLMKKAVSILILAVGVFLSVVTAKTVPAVTKDGEAYYTNMQGATLTKEQYDRLTKLFGKDTVATMDPKMLDSIKDDKSLRVLADTEKYIEIDDTVDSKGKVIKSEQREVSKEEAENFARHHKNDAP